MIIISFYEQENNKEGGKEYKIYLEVVYSIQLPFFPQCSLHLHLLVKGYHIACIFLSVYYPDRDNIHSKDPMYSSLHLLKKISKR